MSTTSDTEPADSGGRKTALVDRVSDWILDRRGNLYGDERERILWYEAIAITASIQWPVVLWVFVVIAWVVPPALVSYLVVVWVAFLVPIPLATGYVARARVRLTDAPANGRPGAVIAGLLIFWLPALAFLVAVTVGLDARTGGLGATGDVSHRLVNAAISGVGGVAVASLLFAVIRRVARRRAAGRPVGEEGDE